MRTLLLLALSACVLLPAQESVPHTRKIKLYLERLQDGTWSDVDPGLVFNNGDRVRFRVESNFSGFLYVVDYGTSGNYSVLFPPAESGDRNSVEPGKTRQVPAGDNIFRIAGPAGQEIVYWIVSPVPLPGYGSAASSPKPSRPAILIPRCDTTRMRARGECVDASAGARDLDPEGQLPPTLKPTDSDRSDLTFMREDNGSVVATNHAGSAPMIYEFRISHN